MSDFKFGRRVENVGNPGLQPDDQKVNLPIKKDDVPKMQKLPMPKEDDAPKMQTLPLHKDDAPDYKTLPDPYRSELNKTLEPIVSRPKPSIDPGIVHGSRPNPLIDAIIDSTRQGIIDNAQQPQQQLQQPTIRPRVFDPRKIGHKQFQDINKDLISRLNIEDREANRRQEAMTRESRIRKDKAAKALQDQLEAQRDEEFFEAERRLDREGIQYDKDSKGRPIVRRDKDGNPIYSKKTGDVEIDPETGRAYRMDRDSQGRLKRIDLDKDAKIEPDETKDDGKIYRKNKHSEWEAIDPEEGRFSSDRRVAVASAKYLYEKEKDRLERAIDDPSLPPKLTRSEKKKLLDEKSEIEDGLKLLEKERFDLSDDEYNESLESFQSQMAEVDEALSSGAERERLEKELYDLEGRGAASFMRPGSKKTEEGIPAEEEAKELEQQVETFKKEKESWEQGIQAELEELQELRRRAQEGGLSAEDTIDLTEEIKRKAANIQAKHDSGKDRLELDAEEIQKRSKDISSRQKIAREEAIKNRNKQLDGMTNPMTAEAIGSFKESITELEQRESAWASMPDDDPAKERIKNEIDASRQNIISDLQDNLRESDQRKSEAIDQIERIHEDVRKEVGDVRIPVGTWGSQPNDPLVKEKLNLIDQIRDSIPERIRESLTEKGYSIEQIDSLVQDFEGTQDVFRNKKDAVLLSDGRIPISPKRIYDSDDTIRSIIADAGGTKEQQEEAFLEAQKMRDQMGWEMAQTIMATKYKDDYHEFAENFIEDFKKKNPHFIDKDGSYTKDSEGMRPTHGKIVRAFKEARGDLWNNIAWNEFGNSMGQILAWIPAMMGSQKYKDAGAQLKKDNEELAQLGNLVDSESFFLGFTKRELMGGGLSLIPSLVPGMAAGKVATLFGAGAKAATTAGMAGATVGAFAQSGAPTYFDARESYQTKIYNDLIKAEGVDISEISPERMSEIEKESIERADTQALWTSLGAGSITAVVMTVSGKLVGPRGVEAILNKTGSGIVPVRQVVRQFSKKKLKALKSKEFYSAVGKLAAEFGINVGEEFAEEFTDNLLNGILEANTYNPDKAFSDILAESWKAGVMGAVLAGGMGGTGNIKNGASEGWKQWRESVKNKKSSLDNIEDVPSTGASTEGLSVQDQYVSAEVEIDTWNPEGVDPASIELDKRLAKAAGKIAIGDIDSVSDADLGLLNLQRNKKGEVESAKSEGDPWATAENGNVILGDTLIQSLSQRHPAMAKILPRDEASQRRASKEAEGADAPAPAPAPAPSTPKPQELRETPVESGESENVFDVPIQGRDEPVQVRAIDAESAGREAAKMNIGMVNFDGIVQTGRSEPKEQVSIENQAVIDTAVEQIESREGRKLDENELAGVQKAVSAVAEQALKWGKIFNGVGWSLESQGTGGMWTEEGNLNFSIPDLLMNIGSQNIDTDAWVKKAGLEEAIHLAAIQLTKERKIDVIKIWKDMPKKLQDAVKKTYRISDKEIADLSARFNISKENVEAEQFGNEFLRMIVQGRMELKDGLWQMDGKVVSTEQSSKKFISRIVDALQEIMNFFNGVLDSDEQYAVQIREAVDLIEQRLNELTAAIEPKPLPETSPTPTTAQKDSAPARGPPTDPVEQFKAWEKGEFNKGEDMRDPFTGKLKRRVGTARGMRIITVPESAETKPSENVVVGNTAQVIHGGTPVSIRYEVRSASDSMPSHDALGRKTEGYPQQFQPRDRSTKEYRQQARNIANNLDFDRAAYFPGTNTPSTTADVGPPIIVDEGAIGEGSPSFTLIGNGRDIGTIESYRTNTDASKKYKEDLITNADQFGLDPRQVEAIADPVLYRVITDEMSVDELIRFSQESNEGEAMVSNAVELAGQDAQRLTPSILHLLDPEFAIGSKRNRPFLTRYTQEVIGSRSANEANITPSDLERRARMAIFTAAYGLDTEGRTALDRMSGDSGDTAKRITNALITVSPLVARMRQDIQDGNLNDFDISSDIAKAAQKIATTLRDSKSASIAWESLSGQGEFELGSKGLEDQITSFIVNNRGNRRVLEDAIGNFVESVYRLGNPRQEDMFGRDGDMPSREQLWRMAEQDALNPKEESNKAASQNLNTFLRSQKLFADRELKKELGRHDGIESWKEPIITPFSQLPQETRDALSEISQEEVKVLNSDATEIEPSARQGIYEAMVLKNKIWEEQREKYKGEWEDYKKKFFDPENGIDFKGDLERVVEEIANNFGATFIHGPIKNKRGINKAISKYQNNQKKEGVENPKEEFDPTLVKDVIRSSIIATSNRDVVRLVNAVYESDKVKIVPEEGVKVTDFTRRARRLHKNRFSRPLTGYKDHLLIVELAPGIVGEIQIHRADMIYAKEIAPGHLYYENVRDIVAANLHKKPSPVRKKAQRHLDKVSDLMRDFYTNMSDTYESTTGDRWMNWPMGTSRVADQTLRPLANAMEIASSLEMSDAPDKMKSIEDASSFGDSSAPPTGFANPAPISQGSPSSSTMNRVDSGSLSATPINTSIPLRAQDLDLFEDYAKSLPARAKASKPVFKRKAKKDLPSASPNVIDNLFDWANFRTDEDSRTDEPQRDQTDLDLGEGMGSSESDATATGAEQPADRGSEGQDVGGRDERRGRLDAGSPGDTDRAGDRGREGTEREGTEATATDDREGGRDARRARKSSTPEKVRPNVGSPERNHVISSQEELNPSGAKSRIKANLQALKLLRRLESENRNATPEEKYILAKFSGWGAVSQLFDRIRMSEIDEIPVLEQGISRAKSMASNYPGAREFYEERASNLQEKLDRILGWQKKWGDDASNLKEILSEDEWETAAASITNAHFTSFDVIENIWKAVERLGYKGGVALEPAGGIGHFFGAMPENLANRTDGVGVELDSISGRIFGKLYPEAQVFVKGYQDAPIEPGAADLVISNVPFENTSAIDDKSLGKTPSFNLHNYFFAKALQSAKPGGLVAFITSSYTMDASGDQRRWLAKHGDLVGAIRLPNTAFKKNAGTEVTTDVIFLRKPDGKAFEGKSWTETEEMNFPGRGPIEVNEYFVNNPEMVMGRISNDGTMRARGRDEGSGIEPGEMTVHPTGDLKEQMSEAVNKLPANVMGEGARTGEIGEDSQQSGLKVGSIFVKDGKVFVQGMENPKLPKKEIVVSFVRVKDALNKLLDAEKNPDSSDSDLSSLRKELNRVYDLHQRKYKAFHSRNQNDLSVDPDYYRVLGLEVKGDNGEFSKADIFSERVMRPVVEPKTAESTSDALSHSLSWRGRVDLAFMSDLLNVPESKILDEFIESGLGFVNPATGLPEIRNQYLSGNVKRKLAQAEEAAKTSDKYLSNVKALENVLPEDLSYNDISFYLGSAWIPSEVIESFAKERMKIQLGVTYQRTDAVNESATERWGVVEKRKGYSASPEFETDIPRFGATKILESVLNLRTPIIKKNVGTKDDPQWVVDDKTTADVRGAQERMKVAFLEWANESEKAQSIITDHYNQNFNNYVEGTYNGQHMVLPWINPKFDLYPSKKDVVFRAIQDRRGLIAHGVGGGKTVIATAIAMEMKRLGLANKPLIAVHNATLEQFSETVKEMAPDAKILVARKKDLAGKKRKEFYGKIATGDWDVIVMAQSTLDRVPDDPKFEKKILREVRDQLVGSLKDVADLEGKDSPSAKEVQKQIKRIDARIEKLLKRKVDDVLTFQDMGIDALILDEAHLYKKLPFATKMGQQIAGIERGASQRGTSFLTKSRFIQERQDGKNVFTMTGTPVTNTLGETWNMIRMVAPDLLADFDVSTFDSFATTFAEIETRDELRPNGRFKRIKRLSKIGNLPEWNRLFRQIADVKVGNKMDVKNRPEIEGGEAALTVVPQTPGVAEFTDYIFEVIDKFDSLPGKEKRDYSYIPLVSFGAARAAAIDIRMVDPNGKDEPGSKLNQMINRALELYKKHDDNKASQVIFADTFRAVKRVKLEEFLSGKKQSIKIDEKEDASEDVDFEDNEFNLYEEIRNKLIAGGVPTEEIADIQMFKTPEAREKLFEKVNNGEVRFVLGSTQKLGTGVNMQRRMIAAHHLDVPWTPADLEQRDGRVYRQGNIFAELGIPVQLNRYGMEESLDAALWDKIEFKERFIRQAMSGEMNARVIEEDEGLLSLAEQKAILMGADGLRFFQITQEIEALIRERNAHDSLREKATEDLATALAVIESSKVRQAELTSALSELEGKWESDMDFVVEVDNVRYVDNKEGRKAIEALFEKRLDAINSKKVDKDETRALSQLEQDDSLTGILGTIVVDGIPVEIHHDSFKAVTTGKRNYSAKFNPKIKLPSGETKWLNPITSAATFESRIREAKEKLNIAKISAENELERETQNVVIHEELANREFTKEETLQDIVKEYREIGPKFDADMTLVDHIFPLNEGFERIEGETVKELKKRVKETYPAPERLEPDPDLYFDESKATSEVVRVPVESLTTTRARPEGIANAEKFMAASAEGIFPKRGPVDLKDNGDGTYSVIDGNSTTAIAKKHGFTEIIGQIVEKSENKKFSHFLDGDITANEGEAIMLRLKGDVLDAVKNIRDKAVEDYQGEQDMVPLKDEDIHITLIGEKVVRSYKPLSINESGVDSPVSDFGDVQVATETTADGTTKESLFIRVNRQESLDNYVYSLLGESNPDLDRDYHVTLATRDGKTRSAVAYPDNNSPNVGTQTDPRLKSQSLVDLTGETDIDAELQRLYREALNEKSGERTIGNPKLAIGAEDPAIMSVDEYRKTAVGAETFEQWNAEAQQMLDSDYVGTAQKIQELGFEGGTLDPVLTRAAQMIVANEMSQPMTKERRQNIQKLVWAYRQTGTEQARGLAARRDPFKTPLERHQEFLGKIIFTPPAKVRKEIDKAQSQEEKQKLLNKDAIRIKKIEAELAKMGVTFDDIFRGEVELTLKGAKILTNITDSYSDKQKAAFELIQGGEKTFRQIGKEVGMKASEVEQVYDAFVEEFERRHYDKFKKGLKPEDVDPGNETLPLKSQELEVEDLVARKRFNDTLAMMGIPAKNKMGKMKTRKRAPKRKMFRPPAPADPEEEAKWKEWSGRDFEADKTDYYQDVMVGVDLYEADDAVKIARLAQSVDSNGWSMAHEYWINNILSGPQTHVVNIAGNVANAAWDFTIQRGMEAMLNTFLKNQKGATFKEYRHLIKGILPGMARGLRLALRSWSTETDFFRHEVLNEQIDLKDGYIKGEGIKQSIKGGKGKIIRIPGRALLFADSFFKGLFGTMEAGAQAYRIAKSQGLKGKELESKITEYVNTPNSQAWQIAVDKATDLTFQTPLKSKEEGGNWAENAVHWVSQGSRSVPILSFLIPFTRTPFNIFKQGIRKSPLGTIGFATHFIRDGLFRREKGQTIIDTYPELIRDLSEQLLAWTGLALIHGAVEGDEDDDEKFFLITGSRPPRSGEAGVRQRATGGDYIIKIGDLRIPYGRIEPFSTIVGTTTDLIRAGKSKATTERTIGQLYGWMLGQAKNKTFMRGLGDVARAIESPESITSWSGRFVKSAIVPNMIRQPIRNADKYDREWRSKEWWYDILPLQSGAQIKINPATGKEMEKAGNVATRMVVPKINKSERLTASDKFLANWNRENPGQSWGPTAPDNQLNLLDGKGIIKLGPKSHKYLVVRSATLAQKELAGKLSPFDIKKPRENKKNLIESAYRKGREKARDELRRRPKALLKK